MEFAAEQWAGEKKITYLTPGRIESDIQNFIVMPSKGLKTLACFHIPDFAGPINRAAYTQLAAEIKLCARYLAVMTWKSMDTPTSPHIP